MTRIQRGGRHRRIHPPTLRVGVASLAFAALTGWLLAAVDSPPRSVPETRQVSAETTAGVPIQRVGRVVGVSEDSVTIVTPDGRATTFRITPHTNQITGSVQPDQHVVVLGVRTEGIAVATAIADRAAVGPAGAPMDYGLPPG